MRPKTKQIPQKHWYGGNSRFPVLRVIYCDWPKCQETDEMSFKVPESAFIAYMRSQGWTIEIARWGNFTKVRCPDHEEA